MHGGFSMESIKNPAEKAGHVNGLDQKSTVALRHWVPEIYFKFGHSVTSEVLRSCR